MTVFKINKNLREIIGVTPNKNGKVMKFNISSRMVKCNPCFLWVKKVASKLHPGDNNNHMTTTTFIGQQKKKTFDIFSTLTVKSNMLFTWWNTYVGIAIKWTQEKYKETWLDSSL